VKHTFTFVSLIFFLFIFSVNAAEIIETDSGYSLELQAPSGQTEFVEFSENYLFESASLKFKLSQKFNNPDWPPALTIKFENEEHQAILLWSLQKPFGAEYYILETGLWAKNVKYPEPITVVTAYREENDMDIRVAKGATDEYVLSINGNNLAVIPFPVEVTKITIGLQSSTGTVNIKIPKGALVDGT
jgi:hypothetical protein